MTVQGTLTAALEAALARCAADHRVALIELKLCGLRRWAVALGHAQAQRLPALAAERARRVLRSQDALFELAPDSIVLLLTELHSEGHAELAVLRLLREFENAHGVGLDASESALRVARRNADALGLSNRAQFVLGDMRDAADQEQRADDH